MDNYYHTPEFRKTLQEFEGYIAKGACGYLDAEELTDLAEYYMSLGEKEKAQRAIALALKTFPGAALPTCFKARMVLLLDNDAKKAEEILEEVADKSDLEYAYTKAEIMIANQKAKAADRYLSQRMKDYMGDEEDFIIDCASLFADYDEYELAEKWLNRSTLTDDDDYKDIQARILMYNGKFDESQKIFNELIDRDPFSNVYWNRLASSQYMQNNISDSITSSEYALAINPNDAEAILNKANGLFALGDLEEAEKYYNSFLEKQPDNGAVLQEIAFLKSRLGKTDEAIDFLDKAEKAGIGKEMAMVTRGYIYLEAKQFEHAETCFHKALRISHYAPRIIFNIGIATYDTGYLHISKKLFSLLFEKTKDIDEWNEGYAYYARCCYVMHEDDEYAEALKIAVEKNPDEARFVLGDLYPKGTDPKDYPMLTPVGSEE